MISHRLVTVISLAVLGFLLPVRASFAVSKPDTTIMTVTIDEDTKPKFRATGSMEIIDRTEPPDGVIGAVDSVSGENWSFYYFAQVRRWRTPPSFVLDGSHDISWVMNGYHRHGPHEPGGTPVDSDPNQLPELFTNKVSPKFGNFAITAGMKRAEHPTSQKPHWDIFNLKHNAKAVKGPPPKATGPFAIAARHTDDKKLKEIPYGKVMGSSNSAGAYISYDSGTGALTIHLGTLDILNSTGSLAPGIDVEFLDDPFLDGQVGDMVLQFLGTTVDGAYRFGGAGTSMVAPDSQLVIVGGFSEYLIRDTTLPGPLDSYALYDSMSFGDNGHCSSLFMDQFTDQHLMGVDVPEAEWLEHQGLSLKFVTASNLAALTAGFTVSALNVPATVAISGSRAYEDPVAVPDRGFHGDSLTPSPGHPNPFAGSTSVRYRVVEAGSVRVDVLDASGRLVRRLVDLQSQTPGEHLATWDGTAGDGTRAAAGVYFYRIAVGNRTWSREVVLVR